MQTAYGRWGWTVAACVAAGIAWGTAARAQEPATGKTIVVTATRLEMPTDRVASAVTVIGSDEIEACQLREMPDLLRGTPGVDIVQAGGAGGTVSAYIRGAKPEHTLVLLDGIEVNNPSGPGRDADLSLLSLENVDRIEVLRGPQGTLYGSDAIGGVIQIFTRRGYGPPSVALSLEAGSYSTVRGSAEVRGGTPEVNYAVGLMRESSQGISRADKRNGNTEEDGYENSSLSARLGWTPAPAFSLDVIGRGRIAKSDYDDFDSVLGLPVDGSNSADVKDMFLRTQGRLMLFGERWEQKAGASLASLNHDDTSSLSDSEFDGLAWKADWQHNLYLSDAHVVSGGVEFEEESARSVYESEAYTERFDEKTAHTTAGYLQDSLRWKAVSATAGVRYDDHSKAGAEWTWRVAPLVEIASTGTRIKGSYGTGFKSPSLFQLYSVYGSPDLKAETSRGWDAGVEQDGLGKRVTVGASWFATVFEDMIDYDYATFTYQNVAEAETHGLEVFAAFAPIELLAVRGSYTWMETEDKATGAGLLRRPRNKASLDLTVKPVDWVEGTVSLLYVGNRKDMDFATYLPVTLDAYTVVNAAASVRVTDYLTVFARVENLFDEDYAEVLGYGTPGLSGYGGIKAVF